MGVVTSCEPEDVMEVFAKGIKVTLVSFIRICHD